jgi:DNA-binding transcriptional ArsR family regulator
MDKDEIEALAAALVDLGLSPYEAERLISIAKAVPSSFGPARLAGIGPDRLALVLPLLTKSNARDLLQLAEQHPVDQLREIIEAREPTDALGIRLSVQTLSRIGRAFEAAGLVDDEEKVGRSEDALLLQIEELAALAGAARTFPVNAEKSSKVARLVLRVEGDRRWTLPDRGRLAEEIEAVLKGNAAALNAKLAAHRGLKARVAKLNVFVRGPDMPANGLRAQQMGFDRDDNPHPLGSWQHRAWNKAFLSPDRSIFSIRG